MIANSSFTGGDWMSAQFSFLFICACLLIALTIIGNVLVIIAFVKEPSLQALTNYWIVSLSCTDLILATVVMPIYTVDEVNGSEWKFGALFCDIFITMDVLCCTCSIYHLVLISLDRYFCVKHPLTYPKRRTRQSTLIAIGCTWFLCAVISVPRLLGWKNKPDVNQCHLTNTSYKLFSSMLSFFLPTLLIIWTYVSIYFLTQQQAARIQKYSTHSASQQSPSRANYSFRSKSSIPDTEGEACGAEPSSGLLHPPTVTVHAEEANDIHFSPTEDSTKNSLNTPQTFRLSVCSFDGESRTPSFTQKLSETFGAKRLGLAPYPRHSSRMTRLERNRQRQEQKAAKVVTVVVSVFLISWTPFFVTNVYDAIYSDVKPIVWRTVTWLGYANSAVNPLIYTLFNPTFRQTIVLLLGCKRNDGRRLSRRRRAVFG